MEHFFVNVQAMGVHPRFSWCIRCGACRIYAESADPPVAYLYPGPTDRVPSWTYEYRACKIG